MEFFDRPAVSFEEGDRGAVGDVIMSPNFSLGLKAEYPGMNALQAMGDWMSLGGAGIDEEDDP